MLLVEQNLKKKLYIIIYIIKASRSNSVFRRTQDRRFLIMKNENQTALHTDSDKENEHRMKKEKYIWVQTCNEIY